MDQDYYIGVDIGGTKISAALVTARGKILCGEKISTPPLAQARKILDCVEELLNDLLDQKALTPRRIRAIGIGIPGIVKTRTNKILRTPNVRLSGYPLAEKLHKIFRVKIFLDNDVNLGLLGEKWLGAGKKAKNIVGIFPGTGIGGALILDAKMYTGFQGVAGEIGHMTMDLHGPKCACGNYGCLEAMASRWAIERDIRESLKSRRKSKIRQLVSKRGPIKSKILKKALKLKDPVVTPIMRKASQALGQACVSLRHLINPEMIILGGGLIEACGDFMLPIINTVVSHDRFFSHLGKCPVVASRLKDHAVVLGAIALCLERLNTVKR